MRDDQPQILTINAGRASFSFRMRELWQYRDLVLLLAKKTFIIRYKQTVLGVFWAFLRPLITACILTVTFSRIVGIDTGGVPGLLFYLCGNSLWSFFAEALRSNANTFTANVHLFGKVYFPRLAVPISNLLVSVLTFGIQMLLLLAFLLVYLLRGEVTPVYTGWLLLPFLVLQLGILGMSVGVVVSSLTTRYRDLAMLVDFLVQLWMYLSPVLYPVSFVGSPALRKLLYLNPVTMPMEGFRRFFLGQGSSNPMAWAWSLGVTLLLAFLAQRLFFRIESDFMDTV